MLWYIKAHDFRDIKGELSKYILYSLDICIAIAIVRFYKSNSLAFVHM